MQAQRKFEQPLSAPPAVEEPWAPSGEKGSPAHLLWEELAARLQPAPAAAPIATVHGTPKWPVPVRIATVVSLSVLCWAGLYMAVASLF